MSRAPAGWPVTVALLLAVPAGASAASPAAVAERVAAEVVHVDPAATSVLPPVAAGRVRLAILDAAIGRIKVAVVRGPTDGLGAFARRVDRAAQPPLRGALVVTNGRRAAVVVSYPGADRARAAVRRAFARGGAPAARLERAVRSLAAVDPGAGADAGRSGAGGSAPSVPGMPETAEDPIEPLFDRIGDTVATTLKVLGAIVALPFLVAAALLLARWRRSRRERRDRFAVALDEVRDDHVTLGDGIRELDEASSSTAPPSGGAYAAALERYDEAGRLLAGEPSAAELERARRAVAEGNAAVSHARAQLGAPGHPRQQVP